MENFISHSKHIGTAAIAAIVFTPATALLATAIAGGGQLTAGTIVWSYLVTTGLMMPFVREK